MESAEDLMSKYKERIEQELGVAVQPSENVSSKEYKEFRQELMPKQLSFYENACNFSEKFMKIKPKKDKAAILQESIRIAHLNITPVGAYSFAMLLPMAVVIFGAFFSFILLQSFFFVLFFLVAGLSLITPLIKIPVYIANSWRMKASNQMVLCIFYVVTYMRHTSNLEGAIEFASEHLSPPLSLDLKKVLWDVESGVHSSVKEALDVYLESWKKYNFEFVEAFHLVESSLYESSEERRVSSLEKSLDVILDETYEKMLHYAQNLKSPITMLHMLGIILPILGLVILPLVVSFMGNVGWYHLFALYNIALPTAVYFMGRGILSTRPTGYGSTDVSDDVPGLKKYKSIIFKTGNTEVMLNPALVGIVVLGLLLLVGFSPLIIHMLNPDFDTGFGSADDTNAPCFKKFCFLGYKEVDGREKGPYGLGSSLVSLFVVLALGISAGVYFSASSKKLMKIREKSKQLETEFASALFQLGNRLGDGLPAEMAVGKVAEVMKGTVSGNFFEVVSKNVTRMGMSVEDAIFNPQYGALVSFPSKIIESGMKVLIESIKKGPAIASQALMNVSRYIKEIHKVNERLKDLMAEIIASMRSQIKFLTPVIAGIVIGVTSMITTIIAKLSTQMKEMGGGVEGGLAAMPSMFSLGIPTFYFQIVVGIYVIQIVYILTMMANGIENGADKLNENYSMGKNMMRSSFIYCIIAFAIMMIFNLIAATIMGSMSLGG